jgi:transposase-like protein
LTFGAPILGGSMGRTYRHYSTAFKISLVERYVGGGGSIRRIAMDAGIERSP